MPDINIILIIASSGRMLAQQAKKSGYSVLVIDCFADRDTQTYAEQVVKVESLLLLKVKEALSLLNEYHISHVVYGSGLEDQQATLHYLEQNYIVLGNSFQVFSTVQNKQAFFLLLDKNKIPHPETLFQQPVSKLNWLLKPLAGEGGIGVKKYIEGSKSNAFCYWQKFIQGTPRSVLFIANGAEYKIIGFHQQFTTQVKAYEFVFSGVINQLSISKVLEKKLRRTLNVLVPELSLQGINSLDYIESSEQCSILEVNARPSASMNLYDSDLFLSHIDCCQGKKALNSIKPLGSYHAYKIIFAKQKLFIEAHINWPSWGLDIPCKGSIIHTGMPICSIIAGGKNEQAVESLLLSRQKQLINLLK